MSFVTQSWQGADDGLRPRTATTITVGLADNGLLIEVDVEDGCEIAGIAIEAGTAREIAALLNRGAREVAQRVVDGAAG